MLIFITILFSLLFLLPNVIADTVTGKDLLDACEAADAMQHAFCLGYVRGVAEVDTSRQATSVSNWAACLPPESATEALVNATVRWIRAHPEMRMSSAYISIEMTIRSASPCR
jgi:hypothetical protein